MQEAQKQATRIIDKWSRMIYNIRSSYDAEGEYTAKYQALQNKIEKLRTADPLTLEGQIQRTRVGVLLPERNAFDFVEKPVPQMESAKMQGDRKKEMESGKGKLQKTLLQLKKSVSKT